jgi:hypothetical protein
MSSRSTTVLEGPRWYRTQIRRRGPFIALIAPAVVGAVAGIVLRVFESAWSGAVGLIGAVCAAPTLLVAGAPFSDRDIYPIAVIAAVPFWLLVGWLAARRSTRNPMASWADFGRHLTMLTVGVWLGAGAALVIATASLGESLF